jgi:hypothetical protein
VLDPVGSATRLTNEVELEPSFVALKLGLEVLVPLARVARRGEAVRIGAVRDRPR